MAEVVTLVDDLDGSTENVTNHVIIIDGSAFTIDLSEKNVDKLHKAFQPFREKARPAGAAARQVTPLPKAGGTRKRASSGAAAAGVDPKAVRVWADENKIDVPTRGRIPKPIIDQYVAATGR
jgi:hypothetical protein